MEEDKEAVRIAVDKNADGFLFVSSGDIPPTSLKCPNCGKELIVAAIFLKTPKIEKDPNWFPLLKEYMACTKLVASGKKVSMKRLKNLKDLHFNFVFSRDKLIEIYQERQKTQT